ncbi:ribonucleotide reductase inhibitor-domain-containing protein [Xylaria bambusicola]|uniref:ribonucleotide reductase inhibitor-domain-containing protein n=1 Tax=Xylaria bambusicola TaxID=326684 RepID=UPI002008B4FA|nr:ribonucleotide reductase inhibitor-domain-containing protein [Xylaria bambusicola]KAI0521017.1 ribonucleotide reductase inhibitor-domain-containing protein [Xylaria bambusicola]
MSTPRTKRQFAGAASDPAQRHITSFFHTASSASTNSNSVNQTSSSATTQRPDNASNLPATVQANLLSVGMRIRKSVPEGYKTGSYNAFALWDETDADSITVTMGEGQRSRANAFSSPRELLPFCGIHRVGGLDSQPEAQRSTPSIPNMRAEVPTIVAYQPNFSTEMSDDEVPGLTSSQESVGSNTSDSALSGARTRKRFFVEDEEETPGQLNLWRHNHDICSLTPVGCNNGRVMAVPRKGRLRAKFSGTASAMPGVGQENVMVVDSDFEEAGFLDRGTWEVNMSDA